MNAEDYGLELLQQYENMITNIAEWRTIIYSILQLVQWKKQQSPRMQSDITLIQNALMSPANFDIGEFVLHQVNILIGYKAIFEQLVESHRSLLQGYQTYLCIDLLLNLERKTLTLITYFNYVPVATVTCIPLAIQTIPYAISTMPYALSAIPLIFQEQSHEQQQQQQQHHHLLQQPASSSQQELHLVHNNIIPHPIIREQQQQQQMQMQMQMQHNHHHLHLQQQQQHHQPQQELLQQHQQQYAYTQQSQYEYYPNQNYNSVTNNQSHQYVSSQPEIQAHHSQQLPEKVIEEFQIQSQQQQTETSYSQQEYTDPSSIHRINTIESVQIEQELPNNSNNNNSNSKQFKLSNLRSSSKQKKNHHHTTIDDSAFFTTNYSWTSVASQLLRN